VIGGLLAVLPYVMAVETAPATAPATTQAGPMPAFEAITYYDAHCANCHGPQGSFYGPTLGKNLTDAQLVKVINDMANGPAMSPIDESQLAAETAYHRAIMAGEPYVSVTKITEAELSGEVMPDAKVTVKIGAKEIDAKVEDAVWVAAIPAGTKVSEVTIVAVRNKRETTLALKGGFYFSHSSPQATTMPAK
jgi:hypothetical protein